MDMPLHQIRENFPLITRQKTAYLDNASTTQKPRTVIDAVSDFYTRSNANPYRGMHALAEAAERIVESTRKSVRRFIQASNDYEIIFTAGATEGLNLLAAGLAAGLKRGDEIILSEAEHHANIVPWQIAAKKRGLKIKYIPVIGGSAHTTPIKAASSKSETAASAQAQERRSNNRERSKYCGRLDFTAFKKLLTRKTKIVSITYASNVTGAITPLAEIIPAAHKAGALVAVDAAQGAAHLAIKVKKLDCDFLVFSGHKLYGPTGIGILYGKYELLQHLAPLKYGGHMIERVTKRNTTFTAPPARFEAGTLALAEIAGLGAALEFIDRVGWKKISTHEQILSKHFLASLSAIPCLKLFGPDEDSERLPVFSFTLACMPAHDLATLLDERGIAVRAGHHCAQILHESFGTAATVRASFGIYNTVAEVDRLTTALIEIHRRFHV